MTSKMHSWCPTQSVGLLPWDCKAKNSFCMGRSPVLNGATVIRAIEERLKYSLDFVENVL